MHKKLYKILLFSPFSLYTGKLKLRLENVSDKAEIRKASKNVVNAKSKLAVTKKHNSSQFKFIYRQLQK